MLGLWLYPRFFWAATKFIDWKLKMTYEKNQLMHDLALARNTVRITPILPNDSTSIEDLNTLWLYTYLICFIPIIIISSYKELNPTNTSISRLFRRPEFDTMLPTKRVLNSHKLLEIHLFPFSCYGDCKSHLKNLFVCILSLFLSAACIEIEYSGEVDMTWFSRLDLPLPYIWFYRTRSQLHASLYCSSFHHI